jgi:hypothetical protein
MLRVVIESPLNDLTRELIERNKQYARLCVLNSLLRGEAPFASHLLYDHPEILDDLKLHDRNLGLGAGLVWGREANLVAVYTDRGISSGMRVGIDHYTNLSIPIEYRSLNDRPVQA